MSAGQYDDDRLYEIQQKHKHDDRENPIEDLCSGCEMPPSRCECGIESDFIEDDDDGYDEDMDESDGGHVDDHNED